MSSKPRTERGKGVANLARDGRQQATLAQIEARFQALARATASIVWTCPANGRDGDFAAWYNFTGQLTAQGSDASWLDALHPDDRAAVERAWTAALASGDPLAVECRVRRADGAYRMFTIRAVKAEYAAPNQQSEWVGVCVDITERKHAESALHDREQQQAGELEDTRRLQEFSSQLQQKVDLDALYQEILSASIDLMHADMSAMQTHVPERQELQLLAYSGFNEAAAMYWDRVPRGALTSCGQALLLGARVIVEDIDTCEWLAGTEHYAQYRRCDVASMQSTPLVSRNGRIVGIITNHWRMPHAPTERELQLLDVLAHMAADIIERTRAEKSLADNKARLQMALDASQSGTFIWYPDEDRTEADEQMLRLFGVAPNTNISLALALDSLIHPDDRARYREEVVRALDSDGSGEHHSDIRVVLQNAPMRWLSVTGRVLFDHQPGQPRRPTRMVGTITDITERKALEQRTHQVLAALLAVAEAAATEPPQTESADDARNIASERVLALVQQAFDNRPIGSAILDFTEDRCLPIAIVGVTDEKRMRWREELAAHSISVYLTPAQRERLLVGEGVDLYLSAQMPRQGQQQGQQYEWPPHVFVVTQALTNGQYSCMAIELQEQEAFTSEDRDLAQAAIRLLTVIIERERFKREWIEAAAREVATSEINTQMQTFVGIAGHELRTPMTSLQANVQFAERVLRSALTDIPQPADTAATINRALALLQRSARQFTRLNRLIDDMLNMTRIASGKLEIQLEPYDLFELVREAVEMQRVTWPRRSILLEVPDSTLSLPMDTDRVAQVITNYLTNALKFSTDDKPVVVLVSVEGAQARVVVRDQGPGLAHDAQHHLWQPFNQVEGILQQSGSSIGLGLGLHISKSIIDLHGGEVGVESVPGEGSAFWFTLPLAASAERNPQR